jgi:hypothetical protein
VLANLIEHAFSDQSPPWRNVAGEAPFTATLGSGSLDFTQPNAAYWRHVDWIVREAHRFGITLLALPAYVGYRLGDQGWAAEIADNGAAGMQAYGAFLADRYAGYPNLIWSLGGDWGPVRGSTDLTAEIDALAEALEAGDPGHLRTAHSRRGESSLDAYDRPWLQLNASYSDRDDVHREVRTSRQDTPVMPTFLIEARYGNESSMSDLDLRTQMWQAVLGGGFGHIYGNAPTWYFGTDGGHPANSFADTGGLDWRSQLDGLGAQYLAPVAALQAVRDLSALTPDYDHQVVIGGYDPGGGEDEDYAPVLAGERVVVAYTRGNALELNTGALAPGTYRVAWYDVRDGTTPVVGEQAFGGGTVTLTPPDGQDWVVLVDDTSLGLALP